MTSSSPYGSPDPTDDRRMRVPAVERTGAPIVFSFEGRSVPAFAGETIGAALAAAGIAGWGRLPDGRRRGMHCGMGACFGCLVTIDGEAGHRACLTKAADGQIVRAEAPAGTADDPLRPLTPPPQGAAPRERAVDLLVIGAGPAGLTAARAAAARGASVVVLDERPQPGGQFFKPPAPSWKPIARPDRQFRDGAALVAATRAAGVEILSEATVWGAQAADEVVAVVAGHEVVFRPRSLIIATGAHERAAPFPGWTLPGVMTVGAAQTLTRAYRVAPGRRVVIAGNGPLDLQLAHELVKGGVDVAAVIESAPAPQHRPVVATLRDGLAMTATAPDLVLQGVVFLAALTAAGVPVLWGRAIVSAEGDDGVERVRHAPIDAAGNLDTTRTEEIAADALCLGYGFVPSTEIARALGCRHRLSERHAATVVTETDANGETSIPGVFAVGDGADLGGSRVAIARGTLAGLAAADRLGLAAGEPGEAERARRALARAERFQTALWSSFRAAPSRLATVDDDTVLCRCEGVTFGEVRRRLAEGRDTIATLKRTTRLGMGRCQGRFCVGSAARLLEETTGRTTEVEQFPAPRLPAKPVPAGALAYEKAEWGGHKRTVTPNLARPVETAPLPDQEAAIVVIGGGVVGSCIALRLAEEGEDVLLVERDDGNLQASGANAGSLHVQLLSFDFGAKARQGGQPAATALPLGPLSIALWKEIEAQCADDFEIRVNGGLMVAETPEGLAFLRAKAELERQWGIRNEILGPSELRRLAPALSDGLVGAEFAPEEGKINPLRATHAVLDRARALGARFLRGTDVVAIERRAEGGFDLATSRCRIRAGRVINAAGPWARPTAAMLGVEVPVHSAPLQMIVTEPAPHLLDHLLAHADRHLSLKQTATGGLLVGGAWTATHDPARRFNHVLRESVEGNLWVAERVLPQIAGLRVVRAWAAMNIDIDGAPIVGPVPGVPGFFNCVTSNGYTLAPIVARLVVDLVLRGTTDVVDPTPYLIDRFDRTDVSDTRRRDPA